MSIDVLMPALGLTLKRYSRVDADGSWHDSEVASPYNTVEYFEPTGGNRHFIGFIEDPAMTATATRIAFRIAREDLDGLRSLLQSLGAPNIDDITATSYPALFFEDPAGTRLELKVD